MKVIEATWEVRNLGCRAFEVTLDKKDCRAVEDVVAMFGDSRFEQSYVTIKMPVGELSALHALEDNGFRFLEAQLLTKYDLAQYVTPKVLEKLILPVSVREVPRDAKTWNAIANMITPGMFKTDRISLDPLFGVEIGCQRYRNWMLDLVDRDDAHLFLFSDPDEENNVYGFTLDRLDETTGTLYGYLGGIFPSSENPGIGISMYDASFRNDIARGARILESGLSSNNPAVVALDTALGIGIRKMLYILRRKFP